MLKNKSTESLNKENEKDRKMEESYKEEYDALKYYVNNKREYALKDKKRPISKEVDKRLESLGYIDWNIRSRNLSNPDYIYTKEGNEHYLKLKEIWQKNWGFWLSLTAVAIALLTAYYTYTSNKDISSAISSINSTVTSMLNK